MSRITKTPEEAFRSVQDQLNAVLNKVLTEYRLQLLTGPRRIKTVLAFLDRHRQPIGISLRGSPWVLSLKQEFQAIPEGQGYRLHILQYAYRLQQTPSVEEEAEVRFEYVSPLAQSDFPYNRHHVQFHRDSRSASPDFSLSKFHIPTGGITIEQVIRFLIADLAFLRSPSNGRNHYEQVKNACVNGWIERGTYMSFRFWALRICESLLRSR